MIHNETSYQKKTHLYTWRPSSLIGAKWMLPLSWCEKSTIFVRGFSLAPKLEGAGNSYVRLSGEKNTDMERRKFHIQPQKKISSLSNFEKSWRRWSYIFCRIFRNLFLCWEAKTEVWPVRFVFMCVFEPFFGFLT